jgi:hypothetical protein
MARKRRTYTRKTTKKPVKKSPIVNDIEETPVIVIKPVRKVICEMTKYSGAGITKYAKAVAMRDENNVCRLILKTGILKQTITSEPIMFDSLELAIEAGKKFASEKAERGYISKEQ